MQYEPAKKWIAFVLPEAFSRAKVTLSSITDSREEIQISVDPGKSPRHVISTAQLAKGNWRVLLNWSDWRHWYQREMEIVVR